jgi:hypothetical protein
VNNCKGGEELVDYLKQYQLFSNPKKKKRKNKLAYDPNCRACQKYGRMLHIVEEKETGYDNKGFVMD